MTTFPLPTVGPTITASGITIPTLEDIISSEQQGYRNIYGQDVDLSSDTQDGELIVIRSQAIYDTDVAIVAVFNGFSPTYAQGMPLSSLVKINGLRRIPATFSTAPVSLVGQPGVTIFSGILRDSFNNQWGLPPSLVFPPTGVLTSTLTCLTTGAIPLSEGSTTDGDNPTLTFVTPIAGWQSATTTSDAAVGVPVESDAQLRIRQSISTGLPATTPLQSTLAAVANVSGVTAYAIYENDTDLTDSRGIPSHSISVVVEGGDVQDIGTVIAEKKTMGTGTFGTTSVVVVDPSGVPNTVRFFILDTVSPYFVLGLHPLAGYTSTAGDLAVLATAIALNSLVVGENAYVNKLFAPANLMGDAALAAALQLYGGTGLSQQQLDLLSATFNITYIHLGLAPNPPTQTDVTVNFHQKVICDVSFGSIIFT